MVTSRNVFWLTVVLLLAACAIRLYHIDLQSIWFDEGWSAYAANQHTLYDAFQADATNPPLYYVFLNITTRFWGDSVFSLRFFSLLHGIVVIALASRLAKQLYGFRAGMCAAALTAFNPLLWWAAQEARMYTLMAVLVLLAALSWHSLLIKPSHNAWILLFLSELAILYTHNTGPIVVIWLNLATVASWLLRRKFCRPAWRVWVIVQGLIAGLWLPYFVNRFIQLQDANSAEISTLPPIPNLLADIWQGVWGGVWALVGREPILVGLSALIGVLVLLLLPWRSGNGRWMMFHILILTGGLITGLAMLGNDLHGRYLVMIAPLLLVMMSGGLDTLKPVYLALALATLIIALPLSMASFYATPGAMHDDAEGMVAYYADTLTAQDSVLAWSYADRYELAYYWDRSGVEAARITLPEGADLETILPLLPESGDIALNVWYTQRADYRGMMSCVLGNGTRHAAEMYTVNGMSTLLYRAPDLNLPESVTVYGQLQDATLIAVGRLPHSGASDRAACVPIKIRLNERLDVDLKVALIIQNTLGWEIARSDAVFAQAAQQTSSSSVVGAELTAYPLVRLPTGTPVGEYPVVLRIYDEAAEPSGYDIAEEDGVPRRDWPIGLWRVNEAGVWDDVTLEGDLQEISFVLYNGMRLAAADFGNSTPLYNGQTLRMTLLWSGEGTLPPLMLSADDGSWRLETRPEADAAVGTLTRDWRAFVIPATAKSGTVQLMLPDETVLAEYQVDAIERQFETPSFDTAVDIEFPGVGTLAGFTVGAPTADYSIPLDLTLVWQSTPVENMKDYTVFVQLLDAQGVLIAQSDARPAQGTRPTTGWIKDEYILDEHLVRFNENAHRGPAQLIVGLYDIDGKRVLSGDGNDYAVLLASLSIP